MAGIPDDYNTVPERIAEFRAKHPEGTLQPVNPLEPFRVVTIGDHTFISYAAAAYRTPDDPRPGIGVAYEPFPGPTAFTRNSELQNAETSAWGRAIVAVGAADAKKGVATAEEIAVRRAEQDPSQRLKAKPAQRRQQLPPPNSGGGLEDDRRAGRRRHAMALFGELGLSGDDKRDERLALTSDLAGHPVGSWNDLGPDEADQVIDQLKLRVEEARRVP